MKVHILLMLVFVSACGKNPARSEVLTWAVEIGKLQKTLIFQSEEIDNLARQLEQIPPTESDCTQLIEYSKLQNSIYNEIVVLPHPEEARLVHNKFIESYGKITDADRAYSFYVCYHDVSYYEKYAIALKEANQLNEDAFNDFKVLLESYSIPCEDVDLCK